MARPRADTIPKEPHSVSLKVLRLSRPSLAQQHPLPYGTVPDSSNPINIPSSASLAYPHSTDASFILSPNLSLPPSFGSAYVGESFSCSLCANNELPTTSATTPNSRSVSQIRILAEMQTPSSTSIPLTLHPESASTKTTDHSEPGSSIQRIIHFDLKEEGTHVLAVNVSYTEVLPSSERGEEAGPPTPTSRVRSFRKLYQFFASPLLSVRTKATELPPLEIPDKTLGPYGRTQLLRYALEAQLENVSNGTVVLERAELKAKKPFIGVGVGLEWDEDGDREEREGQGNSGGQGEEAREGAARRKGIDEGGEERERPVLNPRDVLQLAYLVTQQQGITDGLEELKANLKRDGRTILGQLSIRWRGSMGARGSLSTGGLMSRRR